MIPLVAERFTERINALVLRKRLHRDFIKNSTETTLKLPMLKMDTDY